MESDEHLQHSAADVCLLATVTIIHVNNIRAHQHSVSTKSLRKTLLILLLFLLCNFALIWGKDFATNCFTSCIICLDWRPIYGNSKYAFFLGTSCRAFVNLLNLLFKYLCKVVFNNFSGYRVNYFLKNTISSRNIV